MSVDGETIDDVQMLFDRDWEDASIDFSPPLPYPTVAIYAREPVPPRWAVRGLLVRGEVSLLVGDGGTFKSALALNIAGSVAAGTDAFGRFPTDDGVILYCSEEDPESLMLMRLDAMIVGEGWEQSRVKGRFFFYATAGVSLGSRRWQSKLTEFAEEHRPKLIVLDPLVDLAGVEDENDNAEVAKVMRFVRHLARLSDAAVLLVHHTSKSGVRTGQSRIRGASAISNASRSTLHCERTRDELIIRHLKSTYAPRVSDFLVEPAIVAQQGEPGWWLSACFRSVEIVLGEQERAGRHILKLLRDEPGLSSTEIRCQNKGTGLSSADLSIALRQLEGAGAIRAVQMPGNRKAWFLGAAEQPLEQPALGGSGQGAITPPAAPCKPAPPYRGQAGRANASFPAR